ncbi:MAG: ABC transporter permease [Chloroflexi bacterium HGW-Chloroflexi-1]|nr:MAG: ABC transporter permease [Chloroflexi bacterium HGW-Chloroflexi-1]
MTILSNLLSIILIAARRLWANKGLTLSLLLGWTAAVGLSLSVPLYADAVNSRLLRAELETTRQGSPPFAFRFHRISGLHDALEWEDVQQADAYLRGPVAADIGLPLESVVRYFVTDVFGLFPISKAAYADVRKSLEWVSVGFLSDLTEHITLLEGAFPAPPSPTDQALEVLLSHNLADKLGLQAGKEYILFGPQAAGVQDSKSVQIPVRIAGVWQASNPEEPYWFYRPTDFDRVLLAPETAFQQRIAPLLSGEVYIALWSLLLDGSAVRAEDVPGLLERITFVETRAASLLSNIKLYPSPAGAMQQFRLQVYLLTILLAVFAVPVLGLILYFVALTAGMAVRRQQTEIAVLRSRGASRWQILGVYWLEGLALAAGALGLGIPLGQGIALAMGQIRSFLTLVSRPPLPVQLSMSNLRFALGAVALAMLATLLPALSAAEHTIVTHKQEQARALRRPFWQRYFLDLILLAPPLYGYYLLRQRGTLSVNLGGGGAADPFQNPLLFLAPTLLIFALGLLFIRLFPLLMAALAWLADWLPGAAAVLALRRLARSSRHYTGPLLLLILTLGLAAFTASMALTLDDYLVDQTYYQVGADLHLTELGELAREAPQDLSAPQPAPKAGAKWSLLPVSDHLQVKGVQAAARVGQYAARSSLGNGEKGTFLGLDRVDFPRIAFFRRDFAPDSLGELLNRLALDARGLLVERGFLARHSLNIGDPLRLTLSGGSLGGIEWRTVDFVVAGVLDLFPTQYPEDGPFFVGNLDYAFLQMGGEYSYDVWLATDGERPARAIVSDLQKMGFVVMNYNDARALILQEQTRPARQGLFGMLSVGFLAAAGLTVLGFLLYAVFSFRQRFIELGVLRAIGLSVGQMAAFLAGEQLALIVTGAAAGAGLGVWVSRLFIPFLQVRGGPHPHTPPFVVQVAWADILRIYAVFGGLFLVAVVVMLVLLIRMRVFEAIKLDEVA